MMQIQEHLGIQELLGVYALDAVDDHERALIDEHLRGCAFCRAEVRDHREVAAMFSAEMEPAPERVWNRITSALGTNPAHLPLADVVPLTGKRRTESTRSLTWLTGVAASVAAVLGAAVFSQSNQINDLNSQLAAQEQEVASLTQALEADPLQQAVSVALDDPAARVATLTADGSSGAMLIVVLPDGTGYVYQNTLEQLPDDLTYQLWAVVDDKVISAGVLGNSPGIVPFHIDPQGLQGLVITQEVSGGVPRSEGAPVVSWFDA